MNNRFNRRNFLAASLAFSACRSTGPASPWTGGIVGANHQLGHLLRQPLPDQPSEEIQTDILVIGAGISGLIAALRLEQAGRKVTLLDLETQPGGNATSGVNTTSPYPWGAHYVPVPDPSMTQVIRLFSELGLGSTDQWTEDYLCHDPAERLWIRGTWQEGIVPAYGISHEDSSQLKRFMAHMRHFRERKGEDGRPAFQLPSDQSSKDPDLLALDRITMKQWLLQENYTSPEVHWLCNYACRDDYGAGIERVSAWAGIHYHASRHTDGVFTWPQGNGWLVARIRERLQGSFHPNRLVIRITPEGETWARDATTGHCIRYQSHKIVCAIPRMMAKRLIPGHPNLALPEYAPWAVANLTLDRPLSSTWDNVLRDSSSLGYVVATHQSFHPTPGPTVITWYRPLDHLPPAEARKWALQQSYHAWCQEILQDLAGPHPQLRQQLRHLDVWLWGHAMAIPAPGRLLSQDRLLAQQPIGKIHFAHTDLSLLSLFEEACYHAHRAAEEILGHPA